MEMRMLNLDQPEEMSLKFDLHSYLEYLARLENEK